MRLRLPSNAGSHKPLIFQARLLIGKEVLGRATDLYQNYRRYETRRIKSNCQCNVLERREVMLALGKRRSRYCIPSVQGSKSHYTPEVVTSQYAPRLPIHFFRALFYSISSSTNTSTAIFISILSHSCRGRVIAYGCLIRREGARREHLDYIYRGLMSQHPRFTATNSQSPTPLPKLSRSVRSRPECAEIRMSRHQW